MGISHAKRKVSNMYEYIVEATIQTTISIEAESYRDAREYVESNLAPTLPADSPDNDGVEIHYVDSNDDPLCDGCIDAGDHDKCCYKDDCCEEEGE